MQQWFQQKPHNNNLKAHKKVHKLPKSSKEKNMVILKTFSVEAETVTGQYICISGNCSTLGNWKINDAFVLTNTNITRVKNK